MVPLASTSRAPDPWVIVPQCVAVYLFPEQFKCLLVSANFSHRRAHPLWIAPNATHQYRLDSLRFGILFRDVLHALDAHRH